MWRPQVSLHVFIGMVAPLPYGLDRVAAPEKLVHLSRAVVYPLALVG